MTTSFPINMRLVYLRSVIAALTEYETTIARNREFYEGEQGVALTERQWEYLGDIGGDIKEQALANIARRCVAIPLERLSIEQIAAGDDTATAYAERVNGWWESLRLDAVQDEVYEYALRDGRAALIVGWNSETQQPEFTVNEIWDGDDGQVRLHYNADTGELMYVTKRWRVWDPMKPGETGKLRLTVYFDDRVERYIEDANYPEGWRLMTPAELNNVPNPEPWADRAGKPLGMPVIVFDNPGGSELDDILMPQKALNKALCDLLTASDMAGFPLLWMTGISQNIDPGTGKAVALKFGPGQALSSPDANARFGRIEPADLKDMFDTGAMSWMQIAALVKGWPIHLFNRSIAAPSGEALKQSEASLISQVERKQRVFGDAWRDAFALAARLEAMYGGGTIEPAELTLTWKPAAARDEKAHAEAQKLKWESAMVPKQKRWQEAGYSDEDIAKMLQFEAEEQAAVAAQAAAAASQRIRTFAPADTAQMVDAMTQGAGA